MTEEKILPCPKCGGRPIVLVMRQCLEATLRVQCTICGITGPALVFAARRAQRELLPDLVEARRQAVADWNDREQHDGV